MLDFPALVFKVVLLVLAISLYLIGDYIWKEKKKKKNKK